MTTEENSTVTVHCHRKGGLQLRLTKSPELGTVTLKHGANPGVSGEYMKIWLDENQDASIRALVTIEEPASVSGEPGIDTIAARPEKESSIDAPAPKKDGEASA